MKRRTFLKIGGILGATAILGSCGQSAKRIIPYIIPPDEGINPVEGWYFATTCKMCRTGCGIMVRTVEGRAKKVEGNPFHPLSSGGTCARAQAAVQQLYHPERIREPLKRTGRKGSNTFEPVAWDEALSLFATKVKEVQKATDKDAFIMAEHPSDAVAAIGRKFLEQIGSKESFIVPSISGYETFRGASEPFAPKPRLPYYDIEDASFVLLLGADIFESGFSPVHYSKAYGEMRRGDPSRRGLMVYAGPRLSITAANADEYIGVRPGVLGFLALGIANTILQVAVDKRLLNTVPLSTQERWLQTLQGYSQEDVSERTGVSQKMIKRIALRFVQGPRAVAVAGDDVIAHSNGLNSIKAVEFLNLLSQEISRGQGRLKPSTQLESNPSLYKRMKAFTGDTGDSQCYSSAKEVSVLCHTGKMGLGITLNTNAVHTLPSHLRIGSSFLKVPFIVHIGQFLNETTQYADLVLPDHHFLESWSAQVPVYPEDVPLFNLQQPVVSPMYHTRQAGDILLSVAKKSDLNIDIKSTEQFIKEMISRFRAEWPEVPPSYNDTEVWEFLLSHGGWWSEEREEKIQPPLPTKKLWHLAKDFNVDDPVFDGGDDYPFYLHPYETIPVGDGSAANLPWLLEMPEPITTVLWSSWVEINPETARHLGIRDGDIVRLESSFGMIEAPAYIYPGIAPEVLAVPFGYGHTAFGKYATDRGANPMNILGDKEVKGSGAAAWRSTRVRIHKTGRIMKIVRDGNPQGENKGDVFQL